MLRITDRFDSGNIVVVDASKADDVRLEIRPDIGDEHYQWFHFRVSGAKGKRLRWRMLNAAGASYEKGWPGYRACASYHRATWSRSDTTAADGERDGPRAGGHDTDAHA